MHRRILRNRLFARHTTKARFSMSHQPRFALLMITFQSTPIFVADPTPLPLFAGAVAVRSGDLQRTIILAQLSQYPSERRVRRKSEPFFEAFTSMTLAVFAAPPSPLRDTASATPVCATEVMSPEFIDESCVAVESYGTRNDQMFSDEEDTSNSVWHLLSTMYIPILFLRLRRSFFGMAGLIRSLLLVQCLRFLVTYLAPSPTTWETLAPWLQPFIGNPNAKDPHAWPPPTLRVLAILTIVAFIVHPDGITWIMLGKLRYVTCIAAFASLQTCL